MPGPHPAVAATRSAVRAPLAELRAGACVLVACSGGADSLALAAAVAFEAPKVGVRAGAVIVDHDLQPGSAAAAEEAARTCRAAGLEPVIVRRVVVPAGHSSPAGPAGPAGSSGSAGRAEQAVSSGVAGGPEARARHARYAAFEAALVEHAACEVWLGHTRDDQAEQVLLGLARGSGTRSLAGMATLRPPYRRPFLRLPRSNTVAACAAQGLRAWQDPSNADEAYLRNRVRRALADLEADLGPGLTAALARSSDLARADADALDGLADAVRRELGPPPWPVFALTPHSAAVRGRLWRGLAFEAGAPEVNAAHVAALEALVTRWRGQGPVSLPGGIGVARIDGVVHMIRRGG